ncbi:MAG: hypothetical protein H5T69_04835, partial [Chloroflexi bacterium]|nr:hypothetical protein [Chloroflexota bacterium]
MKVQGKRPSLLPDLSRAAWCVVGAALFVAFFAEFLLGGEVYYPGDAARVYIPERVALKRSLSRLTFPWWDRHLGIGY